jgi:hypothetical protein
MTTKRLGRGLGVVAMTLAFVGISSVTASADSTCYTGCSPTTTIGTGTGGGHGPGTGGTGGSGGTKSPVTKGAGSGSSGSGSGSSGTGAKTTAQSTATSGGGLPFTGADVEELTVGGVGALLVGGILLRRSRNRRRLQA